MTARDYAYGVSTVLTAATFIVLAAAANNSFDARFPLGMAAGMLISLIPYAMTRLVNEKEKNQEKQKKGAT